MIPARLKSKKEYQEYIAGILEYLVSFMDRAHPLIFLDRVFKNLETELEERCAKKRPRDGFELDQYDTVEGLMELGPEKLKEVLDCLGLKSGGTLQQRAERVFLAKDANLDDMSRKHFRNDKKEERVKETALVEAKVKKLCEILKETIERTREHVVNRQGMSSNERKLEDEYYEDSSRDDEGGEEEEEEAVSNPLKLPLGFDGKPIPYWLYKLHGLGQKFNCEICGDHTYCGRREFEMHFKESRHQHGMRCLGIPNTKSFHEITSIEEAKKLWEEIKQRRQSSKWLPEVYEEFEDSEGNVYNKKTYTDLSRQGLI
ncbi:splicing factor SF3a60 homolog [Silene latifolia]|uniref:splicing factor SF3a60 homolog n=1 Tax=Silene latifolia TaxID=37657 RepID=UPI003D77716F